MRFLLLSVLVVFLVGIIVPNAFAQIYITDDATGGGCTTIGTWDSASKTCTLTSDVSEQITIDGDGITLDGNSHTITMTTTAINNSAYHNNITVKNFKIISPTNIGANGIHLVGTNIIVSNNELTDILGNAIAIDQGSAENSYCGYGGSACDESGTEVFGNIITKPSYDIGSTWAPGIYVWAPGAKVYENTVDHHGMGFMFVGVRRYSETRLVITKMLLTNVRVVIIARDQPAMLYFIIIISLTTIPFQITTPSKFFTKQNHH